MAAVVVCFSSISVVYPVAPPWPPPMPDIEYENYSLLLSAVPRFQGAGDLSTVHSSSMQKEVVATGSIFLKSIKYQFKHDQC